MPLPKKTRTTRRDFLKGASATGLLLAMPSGILGAAPAVLKPPPPVASKPRRPRKGMRTHGNSPVIIRRELSADLVVVGGGLSGVCAAIAAARHGASVVLMQDRPMLGGNASSEIRMGIMGAHGHNNKETGILEELQLENIYRNPLMRYTLWDDIMLSAVLAEKITLLLNTSVHSVETRNNVIKSVTGWNLHEYCEYTVSGRVFADCSGDSVLRLSGAEFRTGREATDEFDESFAQPRADAHTMGNSILMQLRECKEHRPFIPPAWAHHYTDANAPKHRKLRADDNNFWFIEYGGLIDTIGDANEIQFELKRVVYGLWAYMKNHPDGRCKNYELDWVGSLPGKRESARLVGDVILNQCHVMDAGRFPDSVAHGGWVLDDHHPGGIHHDGEPSKFDYPPVPFGIPYRSLYSKNIDNLFFAGRNVSCTHAALSTIRVMATCAVMGQAVGTAAALTRKHGCMPRDIYKNHIAELQATLLDDDQMIPHLRRKVAPLTLQATAQFEALRAGHDRNIEKGEWGTGAGSGTGGTKYKWQDKQIETGVWLKQGETARYEWPAPVRISSARAVFDTELSFRGKRMRKLEGTTDYKELPAMLAREFALEILKDGQWVEVAREKDNRRRFWRVKFPAVNGTAARLKIISTWDAKTDAHVFSFEVA
ncbi:hypothetical protein M2447_001291 [Ereboglobus sp. PH5-10]|uniref:FAD-dependent oxidoreductase n=1 Tax=Ereboglobus sp. PH5-10 TaxID=2940629 RepID=UPI00240745D5|nr:FAD-dependent oxidoreductase [Ereboglobus sp. PH5-10]MDF9827202.1 hypothetical protein [Ereboglobus sp. PH5-10]